MPALDLKIPYSEHASIAVDGSRDERGWSSALRVPDPFVAFQPDPDTHPTGATDVWVTSDADAIYLYFAAHDPEPGRIRASLGRRDTRFGDDWVGLYLDPSGTAQRGYLFVVTPAGVVGDGTALATGAEDASWDGIWRSATRRTADGYEVEVQIPWSTVRHPPNTDQVGLLLLRHTPRLGEKSSWPRLDPDVSGALVQMAQLGGPGRLPPAPGLDVLPELTFGWSDRGPAQPLVGAAGVAPGLTARYRPAPSASLLATANPDFSQVESDASQVSVNRRNALYFPEKRPFFLDGQEWFAHPLGELVYTRTMAQPYGGARATVEPKGATVAALATLDAAPTPSVSEGGGWTEHDLRGRTAAESVFRARTDLGRDGQLGVLFSDREILGTGLVNQLGGVDGRVRLSDSTTGSASALAAYTTFADGTRALAPAGSARLEYGSRHPYAGTQLDAIGPGFRAENGYLPTQDRFGGASWAGWAFQGDGPVPSGSVTPVVAWYGWTFDRQLRDLGVESNAHLQFANGTTLDFGGRLGRELWAETWLDQRSGWAWFGGPWAQWLEASVGADLGIGPYYDPADPHSGLSESVTADVVVRPVSAWSVGGSATRARFADLDHTERYDGYVVRARTELFLTRTWFGRLVFDGSTFDDARRAEALVAWERSPGTAVYLGGSRTLEQDPSWTVFAKVGAAITP